MSRYGSHDPRAGQDTPDDRNQGEHRGLLSRHSPQNPQGQNRDRDRGYDPGPPRADNPPSTPRRGGEPSRSARRDDPPPPEPRHAPPSTRRKDRPAYEPYADAPWNQSWQWSDNPQTTESQAYPAASERGRWDESQQWPANRREPEDPWGASREWSQDNQWSQANQWGQGAQAGANQGNGASQGARGAGRDASTPPKKTWQRRLGLTRDQWQWDVLRSWPGVLRLVMVMAFAGALVGLLTFSIRPIPVGGTAFTGGSLTGPGKIKASPTISLFGSPQGSGNYVPPTNTPAPTSTKGGATGLSASPLTVTTNCASGNVTSSATTLKNHSNAAIQYTVTPNDASIIVTKAQATGRVAPKQTASITFDAPIACMAGGPSTHTATIAWNGANGNDSGSITVTDAVTPASQGQPTATPVPPTPTLPAPTDTPTKTPGGGAGTNGGGAGG